MTEVDQIPESYSYDILDHMIYDLQDELLQLALYAEKLENVLDNLARNTTDIKFKMMVEDLLRENPYE